MVEQADQIAQCALDCFTALPAKCKPRRQHDGHQEWTPLSAIVVVRPTESTAVVECVSLATGTKCLPSIMISQCKGEILHDSHAEVLALRGFNRWLLQEVQYQLDHPSYVSPYICRTPEAAQYYEKRPFRLTDGLSFHLFTSEAPCGDASMDLLMLSKEPEDAIPWDMGDLSNAQSDAPSLQGRGNFALLGAVRRKPARADAQASLSKSCSDKLTIKQVTSLISFPTDLFIEACPAAFIRTLIVPFDQYHEGGYQRAFAPLGRAKFGSIPNANFFDVHALSETFGCFEFRKDRRSSLSQKASNVSALWIRAPGDGSAHTIEVILNGVKQGFKQLSDDARKQSSVCRKQMLQLGQSIYATMCPGNSDQLPVSYQIAKCVPLRQGIRARMCMAKAILGNWVKNAGDEDWSA